MYMYVSLHVSVCVGGVCACVRCMPVPVEANQIPSTGVMGSCEPPNLVLDKNW